MPTRTRRPLLRPVAVGIGGLLAVAVFVIGGWVLWSVFRPPPDGFAPTAGQAAGVLEAPPNVLQYTIDARSREDWVYFDFSSGTVVQTARGSLDWDLAFRRTDLLTNGGETNPAGEGGAVDLGEVQLDSAGVPAEGYTADTAHEDRGLENPALHSWYSYNWTTHIVKSKTHTYAVRGASRDNALITFLSYYCDDGSSGCVTFQYVYANEAQ
jgi:HmuY protein